jgi:hypothetical protein
MGATIFTKQAVEVIETPTGTGFLLYEETYEKNCYPHEPHWGCIGVGRREAVLRTVFCGAAVCEGGMLRPRSGTITPEAYVNRWRRALSEARKITSYAVDVNNKMGPMSWNDDDPKVHPIGDAAECPLTAEQRRAWDAGETLSLDLASDFDRIAWLIHTGRLSTWRTITGGPNLWNQSADMMEAVFAPHKAKPDPYPVPALYRMFDGDNELFELMPDGSLIHRGWAYSVIGGLIRRYTEVELADPGWYGQRFRALREAAQSAPVLPQDVALVPFVPEGCSKWVEEKTRELIARHPNGFLPAQVTDRSERYRYANAAGYRPVHQLAMAA